MALTEIALIIGLFGSVCVGVEKTLSGYKKVIQIEYKVEHLQEIIERIEIKLDKCRI